jgi:predicted type IV restriction endonuclease
VDFALCHPARKPAVFIEVKKVGLSDAAAEKQLFEYAFYKGIPMAILTDGQDWQFFLPAEQGDFRGNTKRPSLEYTFHRRARLCWSA